MLHEREPKPGSAAFAAARGVDAVEALEEPGEVFRGDAGAGVGDLDRDVASFAFTRTRTLPVSVYAMALSTRLSSAIATSVTSAADEHILAPYRGEVGLEREALRVAADRWLTIAFSTAMRMSVMAPGSGAVSSRERSSRSLTRRLSRDGLGLDLAREHQRHLDVAV